ncbi:MAG: hypothetical protein WA110_04485 [Anaerolineaceae bacterium]
MASEKPTESTSIKDYYPKLLKNPKTYPWLTLVLFMLAGALIGGLISFFLHPVYEAKAVVSTNMEIVQNAGISEIMVDAEIDHVGELVFHPDVINALIVSEAEFGNTLTLEDLKMDGSVERRLMTTVIKYRDQDPEVAARIASEWARLFYERLSVAYEHAVVLSEAKTQLAALDACVNDPTKALTELCSSLTAEKLDNELVKLKQVIVTESPQSLGLTKDLNVSQYQPAAVPEKPLNYNRGALILAGALIGLLAGLVFIETKPNRDAQNEA